MSKKDSANQDIVRLIHMFGGGETDNDGQIVIYTGTSFKRIANIIEKNVERL